MSHVTVAVLCLTLRCFSYGAANVSHVTVALLCHCFAFTYFALLSLALTLFKWNGKSVTCYGRFALLGFVLHCVVLPHVAFVFFVVCYVVFLRSILLYCS